MLNFRRSVCLIVLCLPVFCGCNRVPKPDGFPTIYPCRITLLQEGKPLDNAQIILFSKDDSCRWAVGGTTDSGGVATLLTHGRFAGVPEGMFIVTVTKTESENANQGEIRTKPILVYTFVDKKFTDRSTSPLEIKIDKAKTEKEFDLGPAAKTLFETISPTGA